jgi:perosamine synthetase
MIRIAEPNIGEEEIKEVVDTLHKNELSGRTPTVKRFEKEFSKYIGTKYAVSVNSGTSALFITLKALKFPIGSKVIVPSMAFIAVPNSVVSAGYIPVLSEIKEDCNIDPDKIEEKIDYQTKAIIVVHTYGIPCDMERIMKIAKRNNLIVIEDVAEAHGGKWKGKKLGSIGDIGCFSFFANKTITTGEGGVITTSNEHLYKEMALLKDQYSTDKFIHPDLGFSMNLSSVGAAIGLAQLKKIERFLKIKKGIAEYYIKEVGNLLQFIGGGTYWMCPFLCSCKEGQVALVSFLEKNGVETRPLFPPIHTQRLYKQPGDDFATSLYDRGICLPCSTNIKPEETEKVVNLIKEFYNV